MADVDLKTRPGAEVATSGGRDSRWGTVLPVLVLILVAIAFAPTLGNGFVNWDDEANFTENSHFRGLGWSQIRWACSTFWLGVYQPLAWLLFELEYVLFGLRPWGYHLFSLILHAAVCWSLFGLIDGVLGRRPAGGGPGRLATVLAVGLFAVHPLRVEAVAWASCQPYLPCALFAILSVVAYLRSRDAARPGASTSAWWYASLAAFVASLLSHATAVGLPLILLALDDYPLRRLVDARGVRRAVVEKWPFFLAAAGFSVVGFYSKVSSSSVTPVQPEVPLRVALAGYSLVFYLRMSLFPVGLQVHYPMPRGVTPPEAVLLLPALGVTVAFATAFAVRRKWPGLLTACVCYVAILLPNLGFVHFGNQVVADRYSYLSSVVWSVAAAYGLGLIPRPFSRLLALTGAAVLTALTVMTWSQCLTWRDSETLWARSIRLGDRVDPLVLNNMWWTLFSQGRYEEALPYLVENLKLEPGDARERYRIGAGLLYYGRLPEAARFLEAAVRLEPGNVGAREKLATALSGQGRHREAIAQLETAVKLSPDRVKLRQRLGIELTEQKRFAEARAQLEVAVAQDPADPLGRVALGRVLAELGRLDEALVHLDKVVKDYPASADAHFNLGLVLAAQGRTAEATAQFQDVLRLRPGDAGARQALARLGR